MKAAPIVPPHTLTLTTEDKLTLIADAAIVPFKRPGRNGVSAVIQKAVLAVLAAYPGRLIAYTAIADRAGCAVATAWFAVDALERAGLIVPSRDRESKARSGSWRVDYAALLAIAAATPLRRHGGPLPASPGVVRRRRLEREAEVRSRRRRRSRVLGSAAGTGVAVIGAAIGEAC